MSVKSFTGFFKSFIKITITLDKKMNRFKIIYLIINNVTINK